MFWSVVKEKSFKANFDCRSGAYFVQLNDLSNSDRGHHEEDFCENILNSDQWFRRRCHLNDISYLELLSTCIHRSKTICVILVECIMRHI